MYSISVLSRVASEKHRVIKTFIHRYFHVLCSAAFRKSRLSLQKKMHFVRSELTGCPGVNFHVEDNSTEK